MNLESETCEEKLDPRVARTRTSIQTALKELLQVSRFDEITVQDITKLAGVNRATFYAHYQDKYDLLEGTLGTGLRKRLYAALKPNSPFDHDHVRILAKTLFEFLRDVNGGCARRREFGPLLETTVQGVVYELVVHWMQQQPNSELARGQKPEVVATVYSWTLFGAGIRWSRMEQKPSADSFVDEVLGVLAA